MKLAKRLSNRRSTTPLAVGRSGETVRTRVQRYPASGQSERVVRTVPPDKPRARHAGKRLGVTALADQLPVGTSRSFGNQFFDRILDADEQLQGTAPSGAVLSRREQQAPITTATPRNGAVGYLPPDHCSH